MQKNSLTRKLRLTSKFKTPQIGQLIVAIHTLPDISRSKSNQTIKLGQLIEYNVRNIFSKIVQKNEAKRLIPDFFLFFKKDFM